MLVLEQAALSIPIAQSGELIVSESTGTEDWVLATVILVGSVILAVVAKGLVARAVERAGVDEPTARTVGRWAEYLIVISGIVAFLIILGVRLGPLFAAFAAIGVAVTFAIQDDLRNLWSGIQLQTRRPFSLGDQISTGEWEGTVEAIKLRSTTLRTPDGRQVAVPNAHVVLRGLDNLTAMPLRRTTLRVGVAWHGPKSEDMWDARSAGAIAIKSALEKAGIQAPTPHQAVWIQQGSEQLKGQA